MRSLDERLYAEYMAFFEKAERERRWSVFDDIPWDRVRADIPEELALVAETFCGVECYLPDYVAGGINVVRDYFGQAWFQANWGYEESKHGLALQEWLIRSGKRTLDQMLGFQKQLMANRWKLPFTTSRQMTLYGVFQEMATFVIYCKQEDRAEDLQDDALKTIFRLIARDEIAHTRFYQSVVKVLLEEDRQGTLEDLGHVVRNFQMPGVGIVPDYDARIEVMRAGGMDRTVFLKKIYFPVLKYLGITRQDVAAAAASARRAQGDHEATGSGEADVHPA